MSTVHSPEHDVASTISLVRDIRSTVGVDIPQSIENEIRIYRELPRAKDTDRRDLELATQKLYEVDPAHFDDARAELIDATIRASAATEADTLCGRAAGHRVISRVSEALPAWERAVVTKFNECVRHFRLNELSQYLPDFSNPKSFNAFSLTGSQGTAVDHWRDASVHMQALWSLYNRLAHHRGDTIIGPAGVDDLSTNLLTSAILGDPGTLKTAEAAATLFAGIASGTDAVKSYGPLLPFIVPPTVGYHLRLHTLDEAQAVRRRLQSVAA